MTVAPGDAARPRTDTSPAALRAAIRGDLVRSATRRRTIDGEKVVRTAELTAYRRDIRSPDVNVVAEARFGPAEAADRAIDGNGVTTTRLNTAAGVAGIYAVVTAEGARRRGFAEAITRHVLRTARDGGYRIAVLQASTAGRGVYERIGFHEVCRDRLHAWQAAAQP